MLNKPTVPRIFNSSANIKAIGVNLFISGYMYEVNGNTDRFYIGFKQNPMSNNIIGTYIKREGTAYEAQKCDYIWHDTKDALLDKNGDILIDENALQINELGHGNYKIVWREQVENTPINTISNTGKMLRLLLFSMRQQLTLTLRMKVWFKRLFLNWYRARL